MGSLRIVGPGRFTGGVRVPGDKSVSHRSLLLASIAAGRSELRGLSDGDDVRRTAFAISALGARLTGGPDRITVEPGPAISPDGPIDLGNSGTGIRLLAGLVAGLDVDVVLDGDASIRRRPMVRVVDPLRRMGAIVDGRNGSDLAPLHIVGGGLRAIDYTVPVASAQVKSAVLLAGLHAEGETVVREASTTRAHTEEMLAGLGADIDIGDGVVRLRASTLDPLDLDVPGDPSQAAFWAVGAAATPDSSLAIGPVYRGPARGGYEDVLLRMGAAVEIDGDGAAVIDHAALSGTTVATAEIPGLIDEIPVLAVAAGAASGTTIFESIGELRVKETDRLDAIVTELGRLGLPARVDGEALVVDGPARLRGGRVNSRGDHRMAMAAAIAAVGIDGETVIDGFEAVETSYPGFADDLAACTEGLTIEVSA